MKTAEHVEYLLRQGRKPKELAELGFSKTAITRVRRQLRKERALLRSQVPIGTSQGVSHFQTSPESPASVAAIQQKLRSVENEMRKVTDLEKTLSDVVVLMTAAREFGNYRRRFCSYHKDGICTLETWPNEGEIPQGIGEPVLSEDEPAEWYIKPSPLYCAMCTLSLESRLDDLGSEVSGNPLSGVKYQITCKGCGSKRCIAAKIKCTKCGRETYWGWFPNE